jgi:DNA-binding NarL/FixJ family response regulator
LREAMSGLLAAQTRMNIAGSYGSIEAYLRNGIGPPPQVILIDGDMVPDAELVDDLRAAAANAKLVLLCEHAHDGLLRAALSLHLDGVLLKSLSHAELGVVIDDIVAGHVVMPAGWQAATAGQTSVASRRHLEVLGLVARGLRNDEIAAKLGLSPSTIKFHLREVYMQLGVRNRVEATRLHARLTRDAA